ncbi:MAG TPA: hypothetical protein VLV45_13055 [Gemmatimonadales bacterium]|nr:hypothetical protein [Gemmatimonadales bacterium]
MTIHLEMYRVKGARMAQRHPAGVALTDTPAIPPDDVAALFQFGHTTRPALRALLENASSVQWDAAREIKVGPYTRMVTPRKLMLQTLLHETRHWSQVATFLRLAGFSVRPHDFLLSPVLDPTATASSLRFNQIRDT